MHNAAAMRRFCEDEWSMRVIVTMNVVLWLVISGHHHHRVIKLAASIVLYICILYHWTLECHPRCRDVSRENIVTNALCFMLPARTHMLGLHWSSPISSSALYYKSIQCGVCLGIAMWAWGYHIPWLVLHSSWPCQITTCPLTSSATRYIVRLLQGSIGWFHTCQEVPSWL